MSVPPISSSPVQHWRYTAEGGANLVVSFRGPSESPFAGHVLRLRKRKVRGANAAGDEVVPSMVEVEFGARVVAPLLGRDSIVDMREVSLERSWLVDLAHAMREAGCRPAEREQEDGVDLDAPVGVLAEDLIAGAGVLAMEIKPKWGFLPRASSLSPETAEIKSTYCRTCMHRYYKTHRSLDGNEDAEVDEGFCPLDLYSGEEGRTRLALEALCRSWYRSHGSINNLRIFDEGHRISPGKLPGPLSGSEGSNAELFRRPLPQVADPSIRDLGSLCTVLSEALIASPLLRTLAYLQASLDALDIEGLVALLAGHPSAPVDLLTSADGGAAEVAKLGPQPTLAEWKSLLARLEASLPLGREAMVETLESGPCRDAVLAYLLSATLKDCSIIVRIPPEGQREGITVKAIDLDPKPIARLAKYARMDREIVACWRERLVRLGDGEQVRQCRK